MKIYKVGDSIYFKDDNVSPTWGRVTGARHSYPSGEVYSYRVALDDGGMETRVSPDQVIDLEDVSRKAGEALDRWHAEDRRKADLLSELLGALNYYADNDGRIEYCVRGRWESVRLSEIVSKYLAKRDNAPAPVLHPVTGMDISKYPQPGPDGHMCSCGCLGNPEDHSR